MSKELLLFRCSRLHPLTTEPKEKKAKEAGELSQTAKTMVREMWRENKFGYRERVMTDEMMKGLLCEQDSMALVQRVLGGEFRVKCPEPRSNLFIKGHCDINLKNEDVIEDIKSSYNLRTFHDSELDDGYFGQGQGYMELYAKKNYRLIYCLVPTPEKMIIEEKKRLFFKFDCNEDNQDYQVMCAQIEYNNELILSLKDEERIKVFEFSYDPEYIDKVYKGIVKARNYYDTITLNGK